MIPTAFEAVQSNEVYPLPTSSATTGLLTAADKRHSLYVNGCRNVFGSPGFAPWLYAKGRRSGFFLLLLLSQAVPAAPSDALSKLRESDRRSNGGHCDSDKVWVGSLSLDGMPLYFPLHDPVAVTPADPVRVRFQMWPASAKAEVRYRVRRDTAYQASGPWVNASKPVRRNDQTGLDSPGNASLEATIPATGGTGPARVDYVVEATVSENEIGRASCRERVS
jgi:hypothetical protein